MTSKFASCWNVNSMNDSFTSFTKYSEADVINTVKSNNTVNIIVITFTYTKFSSLSKIYIYIYKYLIPRFNNENPLAYVGIENW